MESTVGPDNAPSDAELISRVRDGDRAAFGELYGRHSRAAAALARQVSVSGAEADDLVAESFARVLDTMLDGRGPDSAFRAYLFTTLRHTAYDRTRKDKRLQFTDDITAHEVAVDVDDPVLLQMENSFVAKAFGQLPERWRTILWHTQVEGQSPAEVGLILGMSPNAVTSLAFRAREGLREAYLQVHMAETVAERCRATIDRLGAYTRGGLSKRETAQVQTHLAECDRCPALAAELSEINSGLRGLLAPLLLGSAAAGYVATLPAVPALTQVGAAVTGAGAGAGVGAGSSLFSFGAAAKIGSAVLTPAVITGGVLAAAVATVTAVVVGLATPGGVDQSADPLISQFPSVGTSSTTVGPGPGPADPFTGVPGVTVTPPTVDADGSPVEASQNTPPAVDPGILADGPADLPGAGSYPGTGVPSTTSPAAPLGSATSGATPTAGGSTTTPPPPLTGTAPAAPTTGGSAPTTGGSAPTTGGSAPTGSSAPTAPPTTNPPTSNPPTTPPSTPPGTPTTPPAPTPAAVNVNLTTGITGLTAGRTQSVNLTVTNSGGTTQPAGTATLTAGRGINLVGAGVSTPALRSGAVAFARAAAAPGDVVCDGTSCPLPELAPGATVALSLQVQVDPSATATDMTLSVYEAPVLDLTGVEVASSFASVQVVATAPVAAGSNGQFVLTATPAEGVTNPGPVTVPSALSADLYVAGTPEGCVLLPSGTDWECAPDENGQVGPLIIDTVAVPSATGDQQVAVTDAGGRELQADSLITVLPLDSTASVSMTGPFGGTSIAAPTLYCDQPERGADGTCGQRGSLEVPVEPPVERELTIGDRKVVWAELAWASAGSSGDDTVTLNVDGVGQPVTGAALAIAATDQDRMNAHHADVTSLIDGDSTISVTDFAAALTDVENTTPFAVWSLSVIWADPTGTNTTVTYADTGTRMVPTRSQRVRTTLTSRDTPLTEVFVTLWATDPWGTKSVTWGDTVLTTSMPGVLTRDGRQYTVGYDLLTFGPDQLGPVTGVLRFDNAVDRQYRDDGVWIGPVLAIGPAATSGG